ncbi:hypothetical protein NQ315_006988 [Exocentrus adspersus]|uniref:Protein hunchback n=1 Tax=Exocentrus adspersus TaxID=1586481 RepID=A0AAV8WC51_9CUCU|nr:hypothetical protein NQ315_006988 [Exocentrus adspersus]
MDVCRLCCTKSWDLEEIRECTKHVLDMLLINMDMNASGIPMMCSDCSGKITTLFQFKSTCFFTDDFIAPFVDPEKRKRISLKEVYISEKDDKELVDVLREQNLCRLCMEVVPAGSLSLDGSGQLVDSVQNMIKRCIPEVNITSTKHDFVCGSCVNYLQEYCNFMDRCSDIKKYETETGERLEKPKSEPHTAIDKDPSDKKWHKCDFCDYKSKSKHYILKKHSLLHKDPWEIEWYRCELCDYKAKLKSGLEDHMLKHEDPLKLKWYKCDVCGYKARKKAHLNKHVIIHKEPWEIKWYKCVLCDFRTKQKGSLKTHNMIKHKSAAEVEWYKCSLCDYKTRLKSSLKTHMFKHNSSSEIKWHICDLCDYRTKHKCSLNSHMMTHKSPSEIEWYTCYLCNSKFKRKNELKIHIMVKHVNPTVKWHPCESCNYKAKLKSNLEAHIMLKHNNS